MRCALTASILRKSQIISKVAVEYHPDYDLRQVKVRLALISSHLNVNPSQTNTTVVSAFDRPTSPRMCWKAAPLCTPAVPGGWSALSSLSVEKPVPLFSSVMETVSDPAKTNGCADWLSAVF